MGKASDQKTDSDANETLKLIDQLLQLHIPESEETIFSGGLRGYFENPTTDLLAFFMDPFRQHGLSGVCIHALFGSLPPKDNIEHGPLVERPSREVYTKRRNRIDLLLVGENWVAAIEVKVWHIASNPFKDYEEFLKETYPNRKHFLIMLTKTGAEVVAGWETISFNKFSLLLSQGIQDLNQALSKNKSDSNKWIFYLNDFMQHLRYLSGESDMDDATFKIIEDKSFDIYRVISLKDKFNEELRRRVTSKLSSTLGTPQDLIKTSLNHWQNGNPAWRFRSTEWDESSSVVIYSGLRTDESYSIRCYCGSSFEQETQKLAIKLITSNPSDWDTWHEQSKRIICFSYKENFNSLNELTPKFLEMAESLDGFEKHRKLR